MSTALTCKGVVHNQVVVPEQGVQLPEGAAVSIRLLGENLESSLVRQIREPIDPKIQARFEELIVKRDAEALSDQEYTELLALTEVTESHDARRAGLITVLAGLRGQSFGEVLKEFQRPEPE